MKDSRRLKDYDELPLVLDVRHIQCIMGISRTGVYGLVHRPGFPAFRSGRLIKVSKKAFFEWMEKEGCSRENDFTGRCSGWIWQQAGKGKADGAEACGKDQRPLRQKRGI